ncbi:amidohydrolase family protein [Methylomicrobium sp. Wu6]|uniref:amidohydrolase family protein n=1 Tax=Methylomicrobium sp. Wu6 TaxID=3107928 RepID=UPI002DD6572C|nr:amidohydrolase family protein [Methylomicrobium sp. Wu6]MEC4748539.1 amidohydrolase family protein [Methylomicrobium sp. Wu6]
MKSQTNLFDAAALIAAAFCWGAISFQACAHESKSANPTEADKLPKPAKCRVLTANRLFDGFELHADWGVLLIKDKVAQTGPAAAMKKSCARKNQLGDATILPGFIESHAHVSFQGVPKITVLRNGITTVQDTGGPLSPPEGGDGRLRLLSVGPIIQAPGGYPLNIFGGEGGLDKIGYPVASITEAENVVQQLADGGATAIKIALEPGGEPGAPWMMPHGESPAPAAPWTILSQDIVNAIVVKAHALNRRVIVHVGENVGFERALNAGVDEFAHMPCGPINSGLLQEAANTPGLIFVTTIDTLSSCVKDGIGIHANTAQLAAKIADCEAATPGKCAGFLYGSEIGHDNVPWGINGEEMHMMLHLTSGQSIDFTDVLNVFKAATSKAGENLGNPLLGTLLPNAPADVIAVKGNPLERFKLLENPDLVISGGRVVVNHFEE